MSFEEQNLALAEELVALCRQKGLTLATAESCTGGMVGATVTAVAGASAVYLGGVISYASALKESLLGVSHEMILQKGAVSPDTALDMVKGALTVTGADLAVSLTGYAGPGEGAGLVYIAVSDKKGACVTENHFEGDRQSVRLAAASKALGLLLEYASRL